MDTKIEKLAYSPEEFAEASGLHINTIYRELRAGRLKSRRVGKRWVIPVDSARRYLEGENPAGQGRAA